MLWHVAAKATQTFTLAHRTHMVRVNPNGRAVERSLRRIGEQRERDETARIKDIGTTAKRSGRCAYRFLSAWLS